MSCQIINFNATHRCDYCGAPKGEVEYLFQAPGGMIHICDGCVTNMGAMLALYRNERGKADYERDSDDGQDEERSEGR